MNNIIIRVLLLIIFVSEIAHAQLSWRLQALPRDGELGRVTFGAGVFIATTGAYETHGDFLAVSSDGSSWQLIPVAEGADSVASSGTNFLRGTSGWPEKLMSSSNGIVWNPITLPTEASNINLADVHFSSGRYFLMAEKYDEEQPYSPEIMILFAPANLTSWSIQNTNLPDFPECLAYGANQFIASVREDTDIWIYSSTDGASWTKRTNLGTSQPRKIRFLNNRFIAVGTDGSIWVSTDGHTWSKKISPSSISLVDVAFGKGIYVALAQAGHILVSSDANTWKLSPFRGLWSKLFSVAFGGNRFLITGPKQAVLRSN